ncbi:MAG: hypothetical protein KDC38_03205 [Planctomycetes bacterium]|nr:hypothetical protein [Planctomycetota bacterium]
MDTRMKRLRRRPGGDGITMVEMAIGLTIVTIVGTAVGQMFMSSSNLLSQQIRRAHLTARSQVVMDRVIGELLTGQFVTLTPPIPDTSNWIRFQRPVAFSGGSVVYSNPIQIDFVPDQSGETGSLRIWQDLAPFSTTTPGNEDIVSIVAENVPSGGLVFNRFGSMLEVNLTMVDTGSPEGDQITIVSGVRMRNSE